MTSSEQQQLIRDFLRNLARLAVDELFEGAEVQSKGAGEDLEFRAGAKGENDGYGTRSEPTSTS